MTPERSAPARAQAPWYPRRREAELLAWLIGSARLTMLIGEAGAGKTALLEIELLPLLRASAPVSNEPPRVTVAFADWRGEPLPRLLEAIQAAAGHAPLHRALPVQRLVDQIASLLRRHPMRLQLILDGFEAVLARAPRESAAAEVVDQLIEVIARPGLAAHVLIATRDEAEQPLDLLRRRVPGFDAQCLHLPRLPDLSTWAAAVPVGAPAPARAQRRLSLAEIPDLPPPAEREPATPAMVPAPAEEASLMNAEEVYASINSVLARTAQPVAAPLARLSPAAVSPAAQRHRVDAPTPPPASPALLSPAPPSPLPPPLPRPTAPPPGRGVLWRALGVAGLALVAAVWWGTKEQAPAPERPEAPPVLAAASPPEVSPQPVPAEPAETLPPATAVAVPLPRLPLQLAADDAAPPRMAREFAERVGPLAGLRLEPVADTDPAGGAETTDTGPRLAILGYDALQFARRAPPGTVRDDWQIVTPLHTEPIVVVARADGPLRYLHQLQGRRIDVGPVAGRRAQVGNAVYEQLFGVRPDPAFLLAAPLDVALQQMLAGRGNVDAIVLAGAPAVAWLANLPEAQTRQLRRLALDRQHPAGQRALQRFLPAAVAGTPSLAVMDFLVAGGFPEGDERLTAVARALCAALPGLQRDGDPRWREVQPGLPLPTGWPTASAAAEGFRDCGPTALSSAETPGSR